MSNPLPNWLSQLLAERPTAEDLCSHLMFHGTGESFSGAPRPSAVDGLLWMASEPMIAQSYIPASGSSQAWRMDPWDHKEVVRPPSQYSSSVEFSVAIQLGFELRALEFNTDGSGVLKSFSWRGELKDWPRKAQIYDALKSMGYSNEFEMHWIKTGDMAAHRQWPIYLNPILKANHRDIGRSYIYPKEEVLSLSLYDMRVGGEGDLTSPSHRELQMFAKARASGYDGVIIHDFAQTDHFGNFGHVSYGLFAEGIDRLCSNGFTPYAFESARSLEIDANSSPSMLTAEFLEFHRVVSDVATAFEQETHANDQHERVRF